MLKRRDKDKNIGRVDIKDDDSSILQSLSAAHTYSKEPALNSNVPRWDLGSVNQNRKLRRVKRFCNPQTRPSFSSTGLDYLFDGVIICRNHSCPPHFAGALLQEKPTEQPKSQEVRACLLYTSPSPRDS